LSQKGLLLQDLEKTGTRYAAGFNVNKDEMKSPLKKNSTDNENQLMLSPEDIKNRGVDETLRR
jgi:hypothetical protein